jgi:hypothetical protein
MSDNLVLKNGIKIGKCIKVFGFATFSINSFDDEKVHVTRTDALLLVGNLVIAFFMFYVTAIYGIENLAEKSILKYVAFFVALSASSVCIISLICVFFFRNKIWNLLKTLNGINESFKKINVDANQKNYNKLIIYGIGFFVCMIFGGIFLMAYLLDYMRKPGILFHIAYLSFSFSLSMAWIILFHLAVFRRFLLLNQSIA